MDKPRYEDFSDANDAESIATNDAVGGETILPEPGDGDGGGPTGGAPREGEPTYAATDESGEAIDEDEL